MSPILGITGLALWLVGFVTAAYIFKTYDSSVGFLIFGACLVGAVCMAGANRFEKLEKDLKDAKEEPKNDA